MHKHGKGFTLIELIVVMVLIATLSALAIGLFSSPAQYQPNAIREAWINQLRFSQRQSFLKSHLTEPLVLTISQTASTWVFNLSQGATGLDSFEIERNGYGMQASSSNFSGACSGVAAMGFPAVFRFNNRGEWVDASNNIITSNLRLCIASNPEKNFCISPSGFAYGGQCVP